MNVMDLRSAPEWERRWVRFIDLGYTLDDLTLLVKYLRREIKAERRNPGCLKLSNLLDWGADVRFLRLDEDLAMARAAYPSAPPPRLPPRSKPVVTQPDSTLHEWAAKLAAQRRAIFSDTPPPTQEPR
jgi:hypothetical protein